jgi:hypothetical protein
MRAHAFVEYFLLLPALVVNIYERSTIRVIWPFVDVSIFYDELALASIHLQFCLTTILTSKVSIGVCGLAAGAEQHQHQCERSFPS